MWIDVEARGDDPKEGGSIDSCDAVRLARSAHERIPFSTPPELAGLLQTEYSEESGGDAPRTITSLFSIKSRGTSKRTSTVL